MQERTGPPEGGRYNDREQRTEVSAKSEFVELLVG
jgi:hypothetical protein